MARIYRKNTCIAQKVACAFLYLCAFAVPPESLSDPTGTALRSHRKIVLIPPEDPSFFRNRTCFL